MAKKTYTVTIEPITGVHIGNGEELTPLDYKIAEKVGNLDFKKPTYFKFSSDKILARLIAEGKDLSAFERASAAGNTRELQNFFQAQCTDIKDTEYPCGITHGFLKTYNANMEKDPYQNAAKVFQMYHPAGSAKPVIPGSSLKGAIRTAYLNILVSGLSDQQYELVRGKKYDDEIQKYLLRYSDPKNDPFRCVLLGDCVFPIANTQLVGELKNIVFDKEYGSLDALDKLQMQAEVIKGSLLGGSAKAAFTLTLDGDLPKIPFAIDRRSEPQKITPISLEKILAACNDFYLEQFNAEYKTFYAGVLDSKQTAKITELKKILEETVEKQNSCILRVGRWSQVEFVTYEELRKPKVPQDRYGKSRNSGTTRTVFDFDGQYVPLGWCALTVGETK